MKQLENKCWACNAPGGSLGDQCQEAFKSAPNLMWTMRSCMNADPKVQDGNH